MSIPYSFNPLGSTPPSSSISGMYLDGTALKGQLCNHYLATTVGDGADGSTLTDGSLMFYNCTSLTSWTVELPNLTEGSYMFYNCTKLTSWTVELPKLTYGNYMFYGCSKLTSFAGDLTNLTEGSYMFRNCTSLTSWTVELPNLTNGSNMFYNCSKLTSWTVELPNLIYGSSMFSGCNALTSFNAGTEGLKSLYDGTNMFQNCILDETSVLHILNTIPTYTSGTYKLHLGKRTNFLNSTEIATLLGTTTPIAASTSYNYKGWTITV